MRLIISKSLTVILLFYFSFGYADFATAEEANAAKELNGIELDGRTLKLDISTPRRQETPRGRGGRGGGNIAFQLFTSNCE